MPKTNRAEWKPQLQAVVFRELVKEILAETLLGNLDAWKHDTREGECSSDAANTTDVEGFASQNENNPLTSVSCNPRLENDKFVHRQAVSNEPRTTRDAEMSLDSYIEVIVLECENEEITKGSIPGESKLPEPCDIPLLFEKLDNDESEYESSIGDTSGKLVIDLDTTAEEGNARSDLPASGNRFWNFVERLTNAHQTEKEGQCSSAEYKSAPKVSTHQRVESKGPSIVQVPKTACTKKVKEDLKRKASSSSEVLRHKRRSLSPTIKVGNDEKTSQVSRFDEELAKLDRKPHKAARVGKSLVRKKNAHSTSSISRLATSTTRETAAVERTHSTSDTKSDIVKSKKLDTLEHQKVDATSKRSSEEPTVRNKEHECPAFRRTEDDKTIIKNCENLSSEKTDLHRRKHSEEKTVKSRKPEKDGTTRRRSSEESTVTSKKTEISSREKVDETRKKNLVDIVPELLADKIGSDIYQPRSQTNSNTIKLNLSKDSQSRTNESTRTESRAKDSNVNATKASPKKESTINDIGEPNKIQVSTRDIPVDTSTTMDYNSDGDKSNQVNKTAIQRKRGYETTHTDCPLKKQKKLQYASAAVIADNNNQRDRKLVKKGIRNKLRNLFGNFCTISEEAEEDKLIQRKRRKRKHSVKSNDSAISVRETNIMRVADEILNELKNLPVPPLNKKHIEHRIEIPLERLEQESFNYIKIKSKKVEYVRGSQDMLTKLPVIKETSALLKSTEVDNCRDNNATIISTPRIKDDEDTTRKDIAKSTTKEEQVNSSNESGLSKSSESGKNKLSNSISSDVVSSAEDQTTVKAQEFYPNSRRVVYSRKEDTTIYCPSSAWAKLSDSTDSFSDAETVQNDKATDDDEHVVSSTQDSNASVIIDSSEEAPKAQLHQDECVLLGIDVATKITVPCQIKTKENILSISEITDPNQNIIKKQDIKVCDAVTQEERHVTPKHHTNGTDEENKSKQVEKHSEQNTEKEPVYWRPRDMPLLHDLLSNFESYENTKDSIPQTNPVDDSFADITDSVPQSNSIDDIIPSLQSKECTSEDIIQPPPSMIGKLRVRTCEELGSSWRPASATISTSDTSTVSVTTSTTECGSSNSSSYTAAPNPPVPNFQMIFENCTQAAAPEIPQAKDNCNTVTITMQQQKRKARIPNKTRTPRQEQQPNNYGVNTRVTAVCYPIAQTNKSALPTYTDRRQRSAKNAQATSTSTHPVYNTYCMGIPTSNSSSVQAESSTLAGHPRSVAATAASKQYAVYSSGNLSNEHINVPPLVLLTTPKPTCTTTRTTAGRDHKYVHLNKQTQKNPQANTSNVRSEFRVPASVPHSMNCQSSIFTQTTRIAQGASLTTPIFSACKQKSCPQCPSSNGSALGSLQQPLYLPTNLPCNMQPPIQMPTSSTYVPVPIAVQQIPVPNNQYIMRVNQQAPIGCAQVLPNRNQKPVSQAPINQQPQTFNHQLQIPGNQTAAPKQQVAFMNQQVPIYNPLQHLRYSPAQSIQHTNVAPSVPQRIPVPQEQLTTYSAPHVQQTFAPTTNYSANAGQYGQQEWKSNNHPNNSTQMTRTSPQSLSPEYPQQCQPQNPVQLAVPSQQSTTSNPSNTVPSRTESKIAKFELLKIFNLHQQVQLLRQLECYFINCFSLWQHMTKAQWADAQSRKSLLMEFKTVLDDNTKVVIQEYYLNMQKAKKESTDLKETISKSPHVPNDTDNKESCVRGKVTAKEEILGTTGTEDKKNIEKIKTHIPLTTVLRSGEEEMELLRAMYREVSEPEDSETNDTEVPDAAKRTRLPSTDSDQEKVSGIDSAGETSISTTNEMETTSDTLATTSNNESIKQQEQDSSYTLSQSSLDTVSNTELNASAKETIETDCEGRDEIRPTTVDANKDSEEESCMQEKVTEEEDVSRTTSTEDKERQEEIESPLTPVLRSGEEEIEILRAMYREASEPENDTEVSDVKTRDSDQETIIADDSVTERPIATTKQIETNRDTFQELPSRESDQETIIGIRSDTETSASSSNETEAASDTSEVSSKNDNIKQEEQNSSYTSLSSLDTDNDTISNTDLDTSAKETIETDSEGRDRINVTLVDADEDSVNTTIEYIECMSDHDKTDDTIVNSPSDPKTITQYTTEGNTENNLEASLEVEDADNLAQNPTFSESPTREIAIENITSISIDTFDTLDNDCTVIVPGAIDADDIDEMYGSDLCLNCTEPGTLICGGCLKAYCMKHYFSLGQDHSKECQSLRAGVICD